jgi:hypothetical protein
VNQPEYVSGMLFAWLVFFSCFFFPAARATPSAVRCAPLCGQGALCVRVFCLL